MMAQATKATTTIVTAAIAIAEMCVCVVNFSAVQCTYMPIVVYLQRGITALCFALFSHLFSLFSPLKQSPIFTVHVHKCKYEIDVD